MLGSWTSKVSPEAASTNSPFTRACEISRDGSFSFGTLCMLANWYGNGRNGDVRDVNEGRARARAVIESLLFIAAIWSILVLAEHRLLGYLHEAVIRLVT